MNDCSNSCCQKVHLTASVVGSIIKVEFFWFSIFNDSVIVIDEKEYEVNYKYQGQKLLIRYSPDLKKVYVVDSISKELEPIQLLDKNKNATMHRHKLKLSELGGQ